VEEAQRDRGGADRPRRPVAKRRRPPRQRSSRQPRAAAQAAPRPRGMSARRRTRVDAGQARPLPGTARRHPAGLCRVLGRHGCHGDQRLRRLPRVATPVLPTCSGSLTKRGEVSPRQLQCGNGDRCRRGEHQFRRSRRRPVTTRSGSDAGEPRVRPTSPDGRLFPATLETYWRHVDLRRESRPPKEGSRRRSW